MISLRKNALWQRKTFPQDIYNAYMSDYQGRVKRLNMEPTVAKQSVRVCNWHYETFDTQLWLLAISFMIPLPSLLSMQQYSPFLFHELYHCKFYPRYECVSHRVIFWSPMIKRLRFLNATLYSWSRFLSMCYLHVCDKGRKISAKTYNSYLFVFRS